MHTSVNRRRARPGLALLVLALLAAACRDSGSPAAQTEATPPPVTGQVERNVSLTSGGNVALAGEASATVKARSGDGSVTLRITRIGAPGQTVGGAPWLQQVGNLIQLEAEGGTMPPSVDLQLKLVKDKLPAGIDEDHIFAAQVQQGVIRPRPTRVNLRGLTATVAVTEPGTFAVFAVRQQELMGAIRDLWGPAPSLPPLRAGECPAPDGALAGGCRRPSPDGDRRAALLEVVNPRPFYLEVAFTRGQGVAASPRGAVACGNGVLAAPAGKVSYLVVPLDDEVRQGSVAISAAPSPCAQFVQVTTALLGPTLNMDPAQLTGAAAAWYEQVSGNRLLRSAGKAWEAGDRATWAAELATYLMNPDRLGPLVEALGQANAPITEPVLREQAFAAGDVIDAVGGVRAMQAAPSPAPDGSGGPALLEASFTFPPAVSQTEQPVAAAPAPALPVPSTPVPTPAPVVAAPRQPVTAAPQAAAPPTQATPVPTEEPEPTPTPAPTPPPLAAGTGRIVVLVERDGVDVAVSVSLTPGGQPAASVPAGSTTATFDSLRPGSYTVSIPEFGCRRAVTVDAGSNAVVRMTLAANPSTGGFRCTIAGG